LSIIAYAEGGATPNCFNTEPRVSPVRSVTPMRDCGLADSGIAGVATGSCRGGFTNGAHKSATEARAPIAAQRPAAARIFVFNVCLSVNEFVVMEKCL
jgi:hypothetical protein